MSVLLMMGHGNTRPLSSSQATGLNHNQLLGVCAFPLSIHWDPFIGLAGGLKRLGV